MSLLPCPFCGGAAELDSRRGYRNISTGKVESAAAAYCSQCSADISLCLPDVPDMSRDDVVAYVAAAWNKRTQKNTRETVAASSATPEHVTGTSLSSERDSQFPPELATKIRHRTLVTGLRALGDAICVEAADVIEQLDSELEHAERTWERLRNIDCQVPVGEFIEAIDAGVKREQRIRLIERGTE